MWMGWVRVLRPSSPDAGTDPMPHDPARPPHVLMTRFNLATPGREAAIRNQPGWLAERFALFERYCLPSVGAQTTRDFTWIVYFDKDTPQEFKDRIAALQRDVPFHAYYTGLFPTEGWPRSLSEVLGAMPPVVLTSRLDNDDALAVDFIERTAAAAATAPSAPRSGIVVTQGFIRTDTAAYGISHPCNAFTSWLERTDSGQPVLTAMGINHMEAAEFGPLVQVPGPGGWLQVVHGNNVSNKVRGHRIRPRDLVGRFHPEALQGLSDGNNLAVIFENFAVSPLRELRDETITRLRRLKRRL